MEIGGHCRKNELYTLQPQSMKKLATDPSVFFCKYFCHFIDFVCELTVKTKEHTVASYESSDFT
jgi:hypothetical protein